MWDVKCREPSAERGCGELGAEQKAQKESGRREVCSAGADGACTVKCRVQSAKWGANIPQFAVAR